jgi:hypothetical protein
MYICLIMRLSGTYHPVLYLLTRLDELIPGTVGSGAIYSTSGSVFFIEDGEERELNDFERVQLQKFRNRFNLSVFWLADIHFFDDAVYAEQSSLYSEQELRTLCITIPQEFCESKQSDYIFISFPPHFSFSSEQKEFSSISSSEKFLLGKLIGSMVVAEVKRVLSEKKLLQGISLVNNRKMQRIDQLEQELEDTQRLYVSAISVVIHDLLQSIALEYDVDFVTDDELVFQLAKSRCNLAQIKQALTDAATLAYHLNSDKKQVVLTTDYLNLPQLHLAVELENSKSVVLDKTFDLLNRYEEAAEKIALQSLAINGKNIAESLTPPVTPPAISDAIKKNARRIKYYLKEYPTNWPLIRQYLKGIQRLDDEHPLSHKAV